MAKRISKADEVALRGVLEANDLGNCMHPDCDPKQPSCASNYVHLRALAAVREAFRLGLCGAASAPDGGQDR